MTHPAHRRAQCPHCKRVCEQRRTTELVGGHAVEVWRCNECLVSYRDNTEAPPPEESESLLCPLCQSDAVTRLTVRDPRGLALRATDCVDCEQICALSPVSLDHERVESERNQALEAKCALLSASLKQSEARAEECEREMLVLGSDRMRAERKLEAHLVEFADALGLINRFEGQSGYDRARVPEMLQRVKSMEHANDARIEAEVKLAALVREVREWRNDPTQLERILRTYEPGGGA